MAALFRSIVAYLLITSVASVAATCSKNACLRAVQSGSRPASDECERYLGVTVTPDPTTRTVTDTEVLTATVTIISSATTTTTAITTVPATQIHTSRTTAEPRTTVVVKRSATSSCPASSSVTHTIPTYASACKNGAAFVSACSCVGVTKGHTDTLPACTATIYTTVTRHTTETIIHTTTAATSTVVEEVTRTVATATTTDVVTGSSTVTTHSFSPVCSTVTASGAPYAAYYSGAGYSENVDNPGNDQPATFPPIATVLSGGLTPCEAAGECANLAYGNPDNYYSFDLHFLGSTGNWRCVQYIDQNTPGAVEFNVANPDVLQAYGFNML